MMAVGIRCVTTGGEKLCQVKNMCKRESDGEERGQETKAVPVVQQSAFKNFPPGENRQDFCLAALELTRTWCESGFNRSAA